MRVFAALLLLILIAAGAPSDNAPADSYFGRLKMSGLRIRYEIAQRKSRYDNHKLLPEDAMHLDGFTAEAYYQWAARYPGDSWLGSTGYNLAKLYEELPGGDARVQAQRVLSFVRDHFKNTRYSKSSVFDLRSVSINPYPAWATALRARLDPSPAPSESRSPQPSASAPTSPMVAPRPVPTR